MGGQSSCWHCWRHECHLPCVFCKSGNVDQHTRCFYKINRQCIVAYEVSLIVGAASAMHVRMLSRCGTQCRQSRTDPHYSTLPFNLHICILPLGHLLTPAVPKASKLLPAPPQPPPSQPSSPPPRHQHPPPPPPPRAPAPPPNHVPLQAPPPARKRAPLPAPLLAPKLA